MLLPARGRPAALQTQPPLASVAEAANAAGPGWRARLELRFHPEGHGEHRVEKRHLGPLVVQRPFFPEGAAVPHVYVVHPPGGLVGGDQLEVTIDVEEGAHALITTPAATKVYRSLDEPAESRQFNRLRVKARGSLEWLPQENLIYDGAITRITTRVDLDADAAFCGWDIVALGRPAAAEPFRAGRCGQSFDLFRDGRPLLIERTTFVAGSAAMSGRFGMADASVLATLVVAPPPPAGLCAELQQEAAQSQDADESIAISRLDDFLVCRYLGHGTERARGVLQRLWTQFRSACFGRPAVPPRIWMT